LALETCFPLTARITQDGHLEIGGCDVTQLAHEYGTPLYLFDEEHLRARAREIRDAFRTRLSNSLVLYATKAYFSPYLARLYKEAGLGLDVTSEGELEIARRVDFPPDQIYLHGNNKTAAEIRAALAMGVDHIIVDNLDEIDLLALIAGELNARPRVLLRLAPGIDGMRSRYEGQASFDDRARDRLTQHTHKYLATSVAESKFGLPLATGDAMEAARLVTRHSPRLSLVGLQVHIGSQIFDLQPYRDALSAVLDFAVELRDAVGFEMQELDLGGGWGVAYGEDSRSMSVDSIAQSISDSLQPRMSNLQSPVSNFQSLLFEPGRSLIAQAAVALYTVGSVKQIAGVRTYVSVDGGMGDNIRPALYGAKYIARVANRMADAPTVRVAIAGRYCEQGDILIEQVELPRVRAGDLIAIPVAGAYQLPMASNYNLIPRPAVLAVRDGKSRLIRRRETIDDMLGCEVEG
jgi:diaminopimelate decarboxylase